MRTASQGAHISSSCACTIVSVRMPLPVPKLIQVFLQQGWPWAHACSEPVTSRMPAAGLAAQQLSCQARMTACRVMGILTYQAEFATLTISGTRVEASACMPCRVACILYRSAKECIL